MEETFGAVLEVDWIMREEDGKLSYDGFRRVKGRPRQTMMIEVIDAELGIQSDRFLRRCEHLADLMQQNGLVKCVKQWKGSSRGS